jgi:hypothetical protein
MVPNFFRLQTLGLLILLLGMNQLVYANSDTKERGFELIAEVIDAIDASSSYTYKLKSYERVNGELQYNLLEFRVAMNPYRVYMKCLEKPHKGVQITFDARESHGQARVNPGLFVPVLKFDPLGHKMRKDGHHVIYDAGFDLIKSILKSTIETAVTTAAEEKPIITYQGPIDFNGIPCEKLRIDYPGFKFISYQVKAGEKLYDIARSNQLCEFLIRQANPELLNWDANVTAGQEILIPTSYSSNTILYIDSKTKMPIYQEMYDDKGIFEKYLFLNLQVNPSLGDSDFSF